MGCADFVLACGDIAQLSRLGHCALENLRVGLLIRLEGSSGLSPSEVLRFDDALRRLLSEKCPDPMVVEHRVWCVVARSPFPARSDSSASALRRGGWAVGLQRPGGLITKWSGVDGRRAMRRLATLSAVPVSILMTLIRAYSINENAAWRSDGAS